MIKKKQKGGYYVKKEIRETLFSPDAVKRRSVGHYAQVCSALEATRFYFFKKGETMKSLKVGETVKLHHGGSLTQIKDFWSIDNIIKFRDTECKYAAFCREYAFSKWWDGFMCGFCSKVSKAVKAQMADFDFHRVKAPDNKYIPMGYKKIHKLANEEIMGSVKKKPAVKKFSLPDGANPVYVNGLVDIFCKFYKNCRKYVRQEHKNWRYFSCTKCPKASEFIRAQGLNFNIRRVAPKRAKAKILKGKCQQLNVPMGHKVIREKNYRREL